MKDLTVKTRSIATHPYLRMIDFCSPSILKQFVINANSVNVSNFNRTYIKSFKEIIVRGLTQTLENEYGANSS